MGEQEKFALEIIDASAGRDLAVWIWQNTGHMQQAEFLAEVGAKINIHNAQSLARFRETTAKAAEEYMLSQYGKHYDIANIIRALEVPL